MAFEACFPVISGFWNGRLLPNSWESEKFRKTLADIL